MCVCICMYVCVCVCSCAYILYIYIYIFLFIYATKLLPHIIPSVLLLVPLMETGHASWVFPVSVPKVSIVAVFLFSRFCIVGFCPIG